MKRYSFLLWLGLQLTSLAGMSVERAQAVNLVKTYPQVQPHLLEFLDLAPTGSASRLGRHYGELSGSAVGPYEFEARLKNSPGSNWPLKVILNTNFSIRDIHGAKISGVPSAGSSGLKMNEVLISVILKVNTVETPATPPVVQKEKPKTDGKTHQLSWDQPKKITPEKRTSPSGNKKHVLSWGDAKKPTRTPQNQPTPGVKRQVKVNWDQPGQNRETKPQERPLTPEQKKIQETVKRTYYKPEL